MNPYIELLRPSICLMTALALAIGIVVAGVSAPPYVFAFALASAFLICGSGNAINDYYDYKIDKITMPHRPIPSGRILRKNAFWLFATTGITGLAFAALVGAWFFLIALFNFLVSAAYSYRLKRIILLKNITVSYLASSSFLASGFIATADITSPILLLVFISFLATMSREILKDVRDSKGDRAEKIKTLIDAIGERKSRILSFFFLYSACFLLLLPFYYMIFNMLYWVGALPAVFLCIYASTKDSKKSEKIIKSAMYFVLLGFVLGSA